MNCIHFQCQAIVVGFLASVVAMIMGWIPEGKFNIHHGLLLCASSVLTAAVASFVLGMIWVCLECGMTWFTFKEIKRYNS